jgi:hypothetical protein
LTRVVSGVSTGPGLTTWPFGFEIDILRTIASGLKRSYQRDVIVAD